MKKLFLIALLIISFLAIPPVSADRETPSYSIRTTSGLIKRGDAKIYRIDFIATANGGTFALYDDINPETEADIKTEGSEATANNGKPYDFTGKPLEFSTGLYLVITTGSIVIEYE